MMNKWRKIDDGDLKDILINPSLSRRGQYICDCPFCGKEKHFYISAVSQKWDCKKCGEFGNIYKLLRRLNKTYLLGGATIEDVETLTSLKVWTERFEEESVGELEELEVKKMPVGWKVSENSTEYLLQRGVSADDCVRYRIGATSLYRKFEGYVLIPIFDEGEIRGYLGRYGAKRVPENKLRYNNSPDTEFSQLLFGYDEIVKGETATVILVEGVFDKIAVDKFLKLWEDAQIKCVCTFGKKISSEQKKKLLKKRIENVVLLYDFDAIKDIKKYGLELEESFNTTITYTTRKDIDECTEREALEVFGDVKRPRDFNVDVIGKLK